MNRDDVTRWAREAGFNVEQGFLLRVTGIDEDLERFAALVAAHEREACAKVCDAVQKKNEDDGAWMWEARNCAAAIRARGNT